MKIGIIGLGNIAQKAYLPIITQLEGVEPVFCTRNSETLKQLASKYRVDQICEDYQQLLTMGVDAVMIHAATKVHVDIASFFLKNGVPTFVDKPLADSAEDVEKLYAMAGKYNQPLYVGFNRRHIPLYNQHLPELAKGELGHLRSLRWEKHRHALPGELRTFIFDDFIHPLDSINLNAQSSIDDLSITHQMQGSKLARLDVQWQQGIPYCMPQWIAILVLPQNVSLPVMKIKLMNFLLLWKAKYGKTVQSKNSHYKIGRRC